MKLYAIRDRLIDYYLRPFAAEGDKEVIASIAEAINNEQNQTPLARSPQHFEIWRLAEIDTQTGAVQGEREFLADCGSLVRDVRPSVEQRRAAIAAAAQGGDDTPGRLGGETSPAAGPVPGNPQTDRGQTQEARGAPTGGAKGAADRRDSSDRSSDQEGIH